MASEEQHTNANKPDLGARFDRVLVNYLRSEKDMTFKKIGELAGLSESQISRAANGISELPRKPLGRLLRNLGVPLKYLLFEIEQNKTLPDKERELDEDIRRIIERSGRFGDLIRRRKRHAT